MAFKENISLQLRARDDAQFTQKYVTSTWACAAAPQPRLLGVQDRVMPEARRGLKRDILSGYHGIRPAPN